MASGIKTMVINTQERAVSVDINRLQAFANAARAEALRYSMNVLHGTDDLDAAAVLTQITTLNSPVSAEVDFGLTVKPTIGAWDLFVDPGVAWLLAPDSALDDSNYKQVVDPGISNTGVLTMSPNPSGSTRIDVIECQLTNVVSETDNRDIFNPSTGMFAATSVTKAVQAALTYRVRTGTPGGAFPGTASGWLPLAVASVPSGAASNDTITFWDVRPLIADRILGPANLSSDLSRVERVHSTVDNLTFTGKAVCTGWVSAIGSDQASNPTSPGLYRLGGRLRRGTPGTDLVNLGGGLPDGLDLNDPNNQSGTWAAGAPVYVYLLEPFGLPRWSRYTDASSGARKPRSPRGIPVVTTVAPLHFWGCPSVAIALPSSCGFTGASTSKGVCILATLGLSGQKVDALAADGHTIYLGAAAAAPFSSTNATSTSFSGGVCSATFGLVDGTTHPPNAKALIVAIFAAFTLPAAKAGQMFGATVQVNNGSGILAGAAAPPAFDAYNPSGGSISSYYNATIRIPIAPGYPATSVNRSVYFAASVSGFTAFAATPVMQVLGYEF